MNTGYPVNRGRSNKSTSSAIGGYMKPSITSRLRQVPKVPAKNMGTTTPIMKKPIPKTIPKTPKVSGFGWGP